MNNIIFHRLLFKMVVLNSLILVFVVMFIDHWVRLSVANDWLAFDISDIHTLAKYNLIKTYPT